MGDSTVTLYVYKSGHGMLYANGQCQPVKVGTKAKKKPAQKAPAVAKAELPWWIAVSGPSATGCGREEPGTSVLPSGVEMEPGIGPHFEAGDEPEGFPSDFIDLPTTEEADVPFIPSNMWFPFSGTITAGEDRFATLRAYPESGDEGVAAFFGPQMPMGRSEARYAAFFGFCGDPDDYNLLTVADLSAAADLSPRVEAYGLPKLPPEAPQITALININPASPDETDQGRGCLIDGYAGDETSPRWYSCPVWQNDEDTIEINPNTTVPVYVTRAFLIGYTYTGTSINPETGAEEPDYDPVGEPVEITLNSLDATDPEGLFAGEGLPMPTVTADTVTQGYLALVPSELSSMGDQPGAVSVGFALAADQIPVDSQAHLWGGACVSIREVIVTDNDDGTQTVSLPSAESPEED
ncbi:MAG: hypothetical protein ABH823_05070 [bacterium]